MNICVQLAAERRGDRRHDLKSRQSVGEATIIADEDEQIDHPRISQLLLNRLERGVRNAMLSQKLQGELDDKRILRC
jgi:hypothetical protein